MFWPLVALAAAAVAHPMAKYAELLNTKRDDLTQEQLDTFKFYAQHAAAAYCNSDTPAGSTVTCGGACPDVEANGVTVLNSMVGDDTGIGSYVAVDNARQEIILSVRGSNNIRNFLTDASFAFVDCGFSEGCQIHHGFSDAWDELSDFANTNLASAAAANPGYKIVATGHSLGAAVATLAVANLRSAYPIDLYDYGSPRVGNEAFVDFVMGQPGLLSRVTHTDDPIPRVPPMFLGYRHTSPEYWLSNGDSDTIDYDLADIKTCDGTASADCNASTSVGLDIIAHLHYFEDVSSCAGFPLLWKRDDDLAQQLSDWATQDQAYAANL